MRVNVTQQNINEGIPGHSGRCPISLACRDKGMKKVLVFSKRISIGFDGARWRLPPSAVQFVKDFDEKLGVSPMTFEARRLK